MTQVAVPLRRIQSRYSKSFSCRQLPGVVFLTIHDEVQVLEALVHETAHHYLFLAEMREPLVDPSHLSTYPSPLRSDPRPLLGVLLAYHALAYICAFYVDALRHSLTTSSRCEQELQSARKQLHEAEHTLVSSRRFFTDTGQEFLDLTMQVSEFSDD
jgi:HEXXH motif-containing protein